METSLRNRGHQWFAHSWEATHKILFNEGVVAYYDRLLQNWKFSKNTMTADRSLAWTAVLVCILVFRKRLGEVFDILGSQRPFRVVLKLPACPSILFSRTFDKTLLFNPFWFFAAFRLAKFRLIIFFWIDQNLNVFILDCLTLFLHLLPLK